ncbi:MAG: Na(+)-translocating NADH-quinone reductase subunit C [Planctomycetota bacterium]
MQLSKQKDTLPGTLLVAFILCVVCSLIVSGAAVGLRERQENNKKLDQQKNILDAAGLAKGEYGKPASKLSKKQIEELYARVSEQMINLDDGTYNSEVDPSEFNVVEASQSEKYSVAIADLKNADPDWEDPEYDFGEDRQLKVTKVFFVRSANGNDVQQVVLPVYGKGLWGTLYGYMALKSDLTTIQGITFFQHIETPGLGGEVDNPAWKEQWEGLKLYDEAGQPAAMVYKGPAPNGSYYGVDGLSGATITSRGVTNLVRYWAGDSGYKPFLNNLKTQIAEGTVPQPKPKATDSTEPAAEAAAFNSVSTEAQNG